jgi:cell division protein FtsI (penicillin-binding protein 3)
MVVFGIGAAGLGWRALDLQLTNREFLQDHGDARYLRAVETKAHRGMIVDRNGEPLAISTPVHSVWANPGTFLKHRHQWAQLAALLDTTVEHLETLILPRQEREFVYLRRHISPDLAATLRRAAIPGVGLIEEHRRYYPAAEVTAHLLGFTNVDDQGQEGIELAFDSTLKGTPGLRRVMKDRIGRIVEDVERIRAVRPGHDLTLSIDKRIQYVAYRELKAAVQAHHAIAGSAVLLDSRTGEILALVNQPSFNPNNRSELKGDHYRNRAVTDVFEPGSTVKPFTIAAALESGRYTPATSIDTAPGFFKVGRDTVRDARNFGRLDVVGVIEKSSNVGASKIALSMEAKTLWETFSSVGFGSGTGIGLPGESFGRLNDFRHWQEIEHATHAFGYGLSVTALQLARAYSVFATDGVTRPLSIVRQKQPPPGRRVISRATADLVKGMLRRAVTHGTGTHAAVAGYTVAGKTGTVHKSTTNGYAEDRYLSLFAGLIPATDPRLVAVVVIDEPRGGEHFGGRVAAPIFARIMQEATRTLNLVPDAFKDEPVDAVKLAGSLQLGAQSAELEQ